MEGEQQESVHRMGNLFPEVFNRDWLFLPKGEKSTLSHSHRDRKMMKVILEAHLEYY